MTSRRLVMVVKKPGTGSQVNFRMQWRDISAYGFLQPVLEILNTLQRVLRQAFTQ